MTNTSRRQIRLISAAAVLAMPLASTSFAAVWTGTGSDNSGNWTDISPGGSPAPHGWTTSPYPNGVGETADFKNGGGGAVTLNAGSITLGTILKSGGNNAMSISLSASNGLTFDVSAGSAAIRNTLVSAGARLVFQNGTITLDDDLLISNENTGFSQTQASINIGSSVATTLTSAAGKTTNITVSNVVNSLTQGQIVIQGAANTYKGNLHLKSGSLTFNNANSFAFASYSTNTVILGDTLANGGASASLVSTGAVTLPNNINVTANASGTLLLGSTSTSTPGYSGQITLGSSLNLTSAVTVGTNRLTFSGVMSGAGGINQVAGLIAITGSNTYTGDTRISAGTLFAGALSGSTSTALQNSTVDLATDDTGVLSFGVNASTTITEATFGGLKGTRNLALVNVATSPAAVALSIGNNGTNQTYGGVLSGAGSVIKIGGGTQTFEGDNTYAGATSVAGGTLLINGTTSGQGDYGVAATLGGAGTIGLASGKRLTVGGTLAPTGVLSVAGSETETPGSGAGTVNLSAGGTFAVDIAGTTVGTEYDQLAVTGTLDLGGAALAVNRTLTLAAGQFFTVISNDGTAATDAILSTFNGLAEGGIVLTNNNYDLRITYLGESNALSETGNDVVLYTTAVPEPGSMGLIAAVAAGLLHRRRRR